MSLVKLNLASLPLRDKIAFARRVREALLDNAATFPDPPMDMDQFADAIVNVEGDIFSLDQARADVRQLSSSLADKTKIVDDDLRKLAVYVQSVSAGNAATIELAGMDVRARSKTRVGALPAPAGFNVQAGRNPGTVVLRWHVVKHAATYVIQRREAPALPFEFTASETSTRARLDVAGLVSASRYWFRVAANGAAGLSNWTSAVSVVTQ